MQFTKKNLIIVLIATIIGVAIALLAPFEGLDEVSMTFLGIFVWWIILLVTGAIPGHIASLMAVVALIAFQVAPASTIFANFGGSVVWVMLGAMGIAVAMQNCGLFTRIAYLLMKIFPGTFTGQLIALQIAGVLVGPVIPSYNARSSIMAPITFAVADTMGYAPHSRGMIGLTLGPMQTYNFVTNSVFMSGGSHPMVILAALGMTASWFGWLKWFWLFGILAIVLMTLFTLIVYRPGKEDGNKRVDKTAINEKLKEMGKMSKQEICALVIAIVAIFLWVTEGTFHSLNTETVAVGAWVMLMVTGVFGARDFAKIGWPTIFFAFSILAFLTLMGTLGVSTWLANLVGPIVAKLIPNAFVAVIVLWVLEFLFKVIGITPQVLYALLPPIFAVSGLHPLICCFLICNFTMCTILPHMNTCEALIVGLSDGRLNYKDFTGPAIGYYVVMLIASLLSLPYWNLIL